MGSYLTIVNDTTDPWICKVGPDMVAFTLAIAIVAAVAGAVAVVVSGGAVLTTGPALYTLFGVTTTGLGITSMLVGVGVAASSVVTVVGVLISQSITADLKLKGYDTILAGESKRYGKMSLSLWQQSDCKRTTVDGVKVHVDTLFMRPIFSGSTKDSNRDHSIQWWLTKDSYQRETVIASGKPAPTSASKRSLVEIG